jgi:brefeldin A-inhibited guanine nucleotide-exchange protein
MLHHITSRYHDTSHLTHTPHTMHTGTISADLRVEDEEVSGVGIKLEESPSGTAAELAKGSIVGNFDRKQKAQEEIETGILKFNQSSKKGIAFLVERGHVEMTPKSVALFLRQYSEKLDKTAVGEYLGREREYEGGFCLKVLHEFVDSMDFGGMAFDLAIRYFLAGFRLPGEAQKIDRLMEKFAERYYLQNKDTFASADMAFILAFSTIMLQTNLHNPAIKDDKRMTKEQFVKQNKGISADGELPEEMLLEIYERIAAAPISMTQDVVRRNKKDEVAQFNVFQTSTDKRRKDAFNDERKEMVRNGEAMFKQASKKTSVFVRNSSLSSEAYVRPMFEVVWAPIIGVLSEILETCEDSATVNSSLAGLYYSIRLACRLDFPIARHTFLNALAKFTTLETVREMHQKQVSCIKLLLNVALTEGSYLDESWSKVLQCVSQLARLQLFANRSHTDDMFFSDFSSHTDGGTTPNKNKRSFAPSSMFSNSNGAPDPFTFTKLFSGPSKAESARQLEEANASMLMQEINPIILDRIFLGSSCLSGDSVLHFVLCLCEVSMLEISTSSSLNNLRSKEISGDTANPRVFSLQKLVEVADVNMFSRPRLQWGRIWSLLAAHFTSVGLHENAALAMYAIDSLKQLSIKFLQKEELSNFNFQRVFLKPFEVILARTRSIEIKDLVLQCIDVLVRACASNIRSGWRSIFVTFEVAAAQDSQDIAKIALDITERLLVTQFDLLIYDFVELINCLVSFVASVHTPLSIKALTHLYRCAGHLADGTIAPALDIRIAQTVTPPSFVSLAISESPHPTTDTDKEPSPSEVPVRIEEDASVFRLWWPLLLGLSTRVADPRVQVREKALATLTNVLRTYGSVFSPQTWVVIFKGILFPMIDSARTDISWIESMCSDVLSVCIEMLCMLHDMHSLSPTLLPDLISIIESLVCQESEVLARIGMKAWNELITALKSKMNEETMNLVCSRLLRCVLANLCRDFGEAGKLCLNVTPLKGLEPVPLWLNQLSVPKNIVKLLIDTPCPIASRLQDRECSSSDLGRVTDLSTTSMDTPRPEDDGKRGINHSLSEVCSITLSHCVTVFSIFLLNYLYSFLILRTPSQKCLFLFYNVMCCSLK